MTRNADNRTTELREKLTELGVEFATDEFNRVLMTSWRVNGMLAKYLEGTRKVYFDGDDLILKIRMNSATPEQAIAATIGNGTLTAEQVREAVMSADRWEKPMGNTGLTNTHLIIRDDGWQAIADELNAELGSGTCELAYGEDDEGYDGWYCQSCGGWFDAVRRDGKLVEPMRCGCCGRKVKR